MFRKMSVVIVMLAIYSNMSHAAVVGTSRTPRSAERGTILIETKSWRVSLDAIDAYNRGDYRSAFIRWMRMARNGDVHAQKNIGLMFYYGNGVAQDFAEAAKWYLQAAERGYANAQSNMGIMYALGRGVQQDNVQALKWASLAAQQGFDKALGLVAFLNAKMAAEEILAAKRLAQDWVPIDPGWTASH